MKYFIEVTADDISEGVIFENNWCPIALAIKRIVGDRLVKVKFGNIYLSNHDYAWNTTFPVKQFIKKFDNGDQVSPFSFEMEFQDD